MTPERWQHVNELYHQAQACLPPARDAFLRTQCADDEELYLEVTSLLTADEQAEGYLVTPALELEAKALAAEQPSSLPMRQLAHYEILGPLGAGGMGEVHLALDTRLGRKVALKLLTSALTTDVECTRRFVREAHAVSALNHPNIITIHEIGTVENTHFIVTEYIEGETLRQRMMAASQKRITTPEALDLAVQIATALGAAHEAGITHRDIKPENVMVRRDGIVKVLDFGLAKLTEVRNADFGMRNEGPETLVQSPDGNPQSAFPNPQSTVSGVVLGTPRYMSPEQARGEKVDARTDIFSLGMLLYELIAGCRPFTGATSNETIAAILRDDPLPLTCHVPNAPGELERIVSKALRKERNDRYQTAAALLVDLKELKQQLELQAKLGTLAPLADGSASNQNNSPEVLTTNVGHIAVFKCVRPGSRSDQTSPECPAG